MEPQRLTYDMCHCYLRDRESTLPTDLYHKISGYLRSRDIDRLATCTSLSSPSIAGLDCWSTLMQIEAFFKKNKSFSGAERCADAAFHSFMEGEKLCRITNRRLDFYYLNPDRVDPQLGQWLSKMERDLGRICGPFRAFLDNLPRLARVTSGATSTRSRRKSLPHLRVSKRPFATPGAGPYLDALSRYFGYGRLRVRPVLTNRVERVPKSWKTDRTIACEPEGNVFLQLAFDSYIKRRLRQIGINLSDQTRNQRLAMRGSVRGDFATIDLSMASDTLSFNTVAWLFPEPWFRYLNDIRSPKGRGVADVTYAKFSSMGNGCTFGIETVVFVAACRAVGSTACSVYGDDIIIETELVDDLTKLLRFLGFRINQDKSHTNGPFRESCGANWFSGVDVTPIYLRDIDTRKAVLCHIVNSMMQLAKPGGHLWDYLLRFVKRHGLPFVPLCMETTAGVWVLPSHPRARKLIREERLVKKNGSRWIFKVKKYIPVSYPKRNDDIRSLFLWYLDTMERGAPVSFRTITAWRLLSLDANDWTEEAVCRSRYSISSHRYRRKWVHWSDPMVGAPVHLNRWTDTLLR